MPWGVWSDPEDEFVVIGCWSEEEGKAELDRMLGSVGPDIRLAVEGDYWVRRICDEHIDEEQPADACELCSGEEDEGPS